MTDIQRALVWWRQVDCTLRPEMPVIDLRGAAKLAVDELRGKNLSL